MIKRELEKQKTLSVNLANDEQRKAEVAFLLDFLKTNKNDILKKSIDFLEYHQNKNIFFILQHKPAKFYQKITNKAKEETKNSLTKNSLSNPILTIRLDKETKYKFCHIQRLNNCFFADKRKTKKIEFSISELLKLAIDDFYLFCINQTSSKQALNILENQLENYLEKFDKINY